MKTQTGSGSGTSKGTLSANKPHEEMRNVSVAQNRVQTAPDQEDGHSDAVARHLDPPHDRSPKATQSDDKTRVKVQLTASVVKGEPGTSGETMVSHTIQTLPKDEADALVASGKATYV